MPKCNFCSSDGNGDKVLLKLKPSMLLALKIKPNLEYYACEDHFEVEAISRGKRRRWASDASLNVTIKDIHIDKLVKESVESDHSYSKGVESEEKENSLEAFDLNLGKDFFCDSQTISYQEEEVGNEENDGLDQESQVILIENTLMKC